MINVLSVIPHWFSVLQLSRRTHAAVGIYASTLTSLCYFAAAKPLAGGVCKFLFFPRVRRRASRPSGLTSGTTRGQRRVASPSSSRRRRLRLYIKHEGRSKACTCAHANAGKGNRSPEKRFLLYFSFYFLFLQFEQLLAKNHLYLRRQLLWS